MNDKHVYESILDYCISIFFSKSGIDAVKDTLNVLVDHATKLYPSPSHVSLVFSHINDPLTVSDQYR